MSTAEPTATMVSPATVKWSQILSIPEFIELRRRRRTVTAVLGIIAIALFASFLVGFAYFPDVLGDNAVVGIPLSLCAVFSQFAGTWVLVYMYFRLSRTYIQPAAEVAVLAIQRHNQERVR